MDLNTKSAMDLKKTYASLDSGYIRWLVNNKPNIFIIGPSLSGKSTLKRYFHESEDKKRQNIIMTQDVKYLFSPNINDSKTLVCVSSEIMNAAQDIFPTNFYRTDRSAMGKFYLRWFDNTGTLNAGTFTVPEDWFSLNYQIRA